MISRKRGMFVWRVSRTGIDTGWYPATENALSYRSGVSSEGSLSNKTFAIAGRGYEVETAKPEAGVSVTFVTSNNHGHFKKRKTSSFIVRQCGF